MKLYAVGILLLFFVGLIRWWTDVSWNEPHWDEIAYLDAVEALQDGRSPYDAPKFVYNPPFALLVARLSGAYSPIDALRLFRVLGLLGLAGLVWVSLEGTRWRFSTRLFVGLAIVTLSPMVATSMLYGNVTLLFAGMSVCALSWAANRGVRLWVSPRIGCWQQTDGRTSPGGSFGGTQGLSSFRWFGSRSGRCSHTMLGPEVPSGSSTPCRRTAGCVLEHLTPPCALLFRY